MKAIHSSPQSTFPSLLAGSRCSRLLPSVLQLALMALLAAASQGARATTTTFTNAGPNTWVCPSSGVSTVQVECWGGGGAGGGANNTVGSAGGGGAGGAYARVSSYAVTPNTTYYLQVGAAGAYAAAGNNPGGAGGDSWFSNSALPVVVLAKGGGGGGGGSASVGGSGGLTNGESASVGSTVYLGGPGLTAVFGSYSGGGGGSGGNATNGNPGASTGAAAAVTDGGPGGPAKSSANQGVAPASGFGGGGGGGYSGNDTKHGGSGWYGQVVITYGTSLFKSVANGNWSNPGTWNTSGDGGVTWQPAAVQPDTNAASAIFITNGFTVTVDVPVSAVNLMVDVGSTLNIGPAGSLTSAGALTGTYSSPILDNGGIIDNDDATTNQTIVGTISGIGGVTNGSLSTLNIRGTNTFTGGLYVLNGEVLGTGLNQFIFGGSGTGAITLGSPSGSFATLATGKNPNNPITLGAGAAGTLTISNNNTTTTPIYGGAINLNGNNLTIGVGGTAGVTTVSGGISGAGSLTLNMDTGSNGIVFSGAPINNAGSITLQGASTGTATISSVIGANVTGITQNCASVPLTLSAVDTYTGSTTLNGGEIIGITGGSAANSGLVFAASPATFSVSVTNNTLPWTYASFNAAATGDLDFNFGSIAPSASVAPLQITGLAAFAAQPTVTIEGLNFPVGNFPLMTWGSDSGTPPSNVILPGTLAGYLNVVGNTLYLVVTSGTEGHKANNTLALSNPASWVEDNVPIAGAVWDNTVTSPNTTVLGGDMAWAGIQILNPGGLVTISADGNTLTNDVSIDLSAATADLTLGCNLDLGGNNTWNVASGRTLTVSGVVSDMYTVTKQGAGTVVCTGGNTYTNSTTVSAGVLTVGNGGAITNFGTITVADTVNTSATLNISGGTIVTTNNVIHVGTVSNACGVINLSSGSLMTSNQVHLGNGTTGVAGFGALNITGGSAIIGGYLAPGRGTAASSQSRGEVLVSGNGSLLVTANNIEVGSFDLVPTNTSVMTVSGNSTTTVGAGGGGILVGKNGNGILNVSGSAAVTVLNPAQSLELGAVAGVTGIVNLNGGTITTPSVSQNVSGIGYFNFNGGTLMANKNNATFMAGLTAAYVYSGGAILNDGGFSITNAQALLTPATGSGVSLAGMTFGGSGFVAPPIVDIGGTGSGASAIATIDGNGNITGVTLTSPGVGYTGTPSLLFVGGGGTVTHTGSASTAANSCGGLTKVGAGALTLSGVSTYTGGTVVSNGTLALSSTGQLTGTTNIAIEAGATFDVSAATSWTLGAAQKLTGLGTVNGTVVANGMVAPGFSTNGTLTFNNSLALGGTTVMKINHDNGIANDNLTVSGILALGGTLNVVTNGVTPLQVNDTFPLFSAGTLGAGFGNLNLPAGYVWDTTQLGTNGTIRVAAVGGRTHPRFTTMTVNNGSIILSGTNATGTYVLYSTTNLSTSVWVPVFTNTFGGAFSFTNGMGGAQKFYQLQ